ncbi:MAG: SMC-Scp complex subunit ScpB [Phycisphaerales bacterium JB063]
MSENTDVPVSDDAEPTQEPAQADAFEDAEQAEQADAEQPTAPVVLPEDLPARVEAALMTSERPMTAARTAEALGLKGAGAAIEEAIQELNDAYARTGRSFRIEKIAGSYQVVTLPAYADALDGLKRTRENNKLSASQLETLAIVAYKQPVVRADIEAIRGAASGEVLRALMDRHLVKIVGRAEELGRPMLYGTTKQFMEVFGLGTLKDLPEVDQLKPVV